MPCPGSLAAFAHANNAPLEEHVERLFTQNQEVINTSISHYKMILRVLFDHSPLTPQTARSLNGQSVTSLTSNYLCLQCPTILTEEERLKHGTKKSHRFCMCLGRLTLEPPTTR